MSPWDKEGACWACRVTGKPGRELAVREAGMWPLLLSGPVLGHGGGGVVCVRQVGGGLVHALDFTPMNPSYPK